MNDLRPSWDEYFMNVAGAVAQRADCRRAKVGALIVDNDHRIVSTGYNGVAPGREGCLAGKCPRGLKKRGEGFVGGFITDCIAFHAEVNAILYAGRSQAKGNVLYVNKLPCMDCFRTMEAVGLRRVVYLDPTDIMISMPVVEWRTPWETSISVEEVGESC